MGRRQCEMEGCCKRIQAVARRTARRTEAAGAASTRAARSPLDTARSSARRTEAASAANARAASSPR
jgi:hypothetical protein